MFKKDKINIHKLLGFLLSAFTLAYFFLKIPPESSFIVAVFVLLVLINVLYITSFFRVSKKYRIIIALTVMLFFISNILSGFNPSNTLLLLSFIIGVSILLK